MSVTAELDHAVAHTAQASQPNSRSQLETRIADRRLSWTRPLVVLPSRILFMLLAQGLVAIAFFRYSARPWFAAAPWWTVYGTLIDIGCLILLWKYTRHENITFRDLLGPVHLRYGRDIFLGIAVFLAVFPFFAVGGLLACKLVYGVYQVNAFPGILGGRVLPLWAALYSRSIWWMIWSPTEEMFYAGYLLPRTQALSKRTWVAVALVGVVWAIQHSFLPFLPEWRNFVWRFLAFVPGIIVMSLIYLRMRRLGPLILAHWAMDIIATIMTMA